LTWFYAEAMTSAHRMPDKIQHLSTLLIQAGELGKDLFGEAAASMNLPVPVARAILLLDEPAPMAHLADNLTCDRSYVTSITDQLEELGLVTRETGADRRVKLLTLTDKGKKTRDKLSKLVNEKSLVSRKLSESERTTLERLMKRLLED